MNRERWLQIKQIVNACLDMEPEGRAAYITRVCDGDSVLLGDVNSLLASHAELGDFMEMQALKQELDGASKVASTVLVQDSAPPDSPGEDASLGGERLIGLRIGAYQIVEKIGSGGMGEVYRAFRADDQYCKQVAIKLVRAGPESQALVQRFKNERQILASLDHPNIARLFDGGRTKEGVPYFVMELVHGQPMDEYCDQHKPSITDRLKLFLQVCAAVQYAHQRLIIHRDIKPSNILVTPEGVPKLLDFGLAKILDEGATPELYETTLTGYRVLTPGYASPEQVRGDSITIASDVYSLGVVLYELLTGRSPYRVASRTPHDLARAACEEEPEKPSSAVRPTQSHGIGSLAIDPAKAAEVRLSSLDRLSKRLSGDLDTIVLMALRKEPRRRYGSVEQFVQDIQRHLENHPVIARGDTPFYRASKFVRRHRVGVALVASTFALITSLSIALTVQSARLIRERDKAQQVSALFADLFTLADPDQARGAQITAQEILDRGVERIRGGLRGQKEVKASLIDLLATVYHKLGLYEQAAQLIQQSLDLRRQSFAPDQREIANSMQRLGVVYNDQAKYDDAIAVLRQTFELRRRLLGATDSATAVTMTYLGLAYFRKADYAHAQPLFEQAAAIQRNNQSQTAELADCLTGLALLHYAKGEYAKSEPLLWQSLEIRRKVFGAEHSQIADTLNNLASVMSRLGRDKESERLQREAISILRKVLPNHPKLATTLNNLGLILLARGDEIAAEPLFRESIEIRRARLNALHPDLAQTLNNLGFLLYSWGRLTEARPLLEEALKIRRKALGSNHPATLDSLGNFGRLLQDESHQAQAEAMLREAVEKGEKIIGPEHPIFAIHLTNLASLLADKGDSSGAEGLYRRSLAIRRKTLPAGHPHMAYSLLGLGQVLTAKGDVSAAEPMLREALAIRQKSMPAGHWQVAEAESALGWCLGRMNREEEARPLLAAALDTLSRQLGSSHRLTRTALRRLAEIGEPR